MKHVLNTCILIGPQTPSAVLEKMKNICGDQPELEAGLTLAITGAGIPNIPWAASIGADQGDKFEHHCTATVLSPGILLTAAHCFKSSIYNATTFKADMQKVETLPPAGFQFKMSTYWEN